MNRLNKFAIFFGIQAGCYIIAALIFAVAAPADIGIRGAITYLLLTFGISLGIGIVTVK